MTYAAMAAWPRPLGWWVGAAGLCRGRPGSAASRAGGPVQGCRWSRCGADPWRSIHRPRAPHPDDRPASPVRLRLHHPGAYQRHLIGWDRSGSKPIAIRPSTCCSTCPRRGFPITPAEPSSDWR